MSVTKDLTGLKYNYLTVISLKERKNSKGYWNCICDCGKECLVEGQHIWTGHTKSCGCYSIKLLKERATTHNLTSHHLHSIWTNMKNRCRNPKMLMYYRYGGRGIKVCKEWDKSFESFYSWCIENGYEKGLQIDRIDNDGNYEPENCRWVTRSENIRNSTTVKITEKEAEEIRNSKLSVKELEKLYNLKKSAIYYIKSGKFWKILE
jgi:hypothetical protein